MGRSLAVIVLVALAASASQAAVFDVAADGSGDYPTIQAALDAAALGDTVRLADGIYSGLGNRELHFYGESLLSASGDPMAAVVDAEGYALVQSQSAGNVWIESVGFRNGTRMLFLYSDTVYFTNCRFEACNGVVSIGNPVDSARANFDGCVVEGCYGSGLISANYVHLIGCRFSGNLAQITGASHVDCQGTNFTANACETLLAHHFTPEGGSVDYRDCLFRDNEVGRLIDMGDIYQMNFTRCGFIRNSRTCFEIQIYSEYEQVAFDACTFVGNGHDDGHELGINVLDGGPATVSANRCIFAYRQGGTLLELGAGVPAPTFTDCDIVGNAGGDWTGPIADQLGVGCNMAANPQLCAWWLGELTLYDISPCLPANNGCGVLIGAGGEGCVAVTDVSEANTPAKARLAPNHPNPFNPTTRLSFSLAADERVDLRIYDSAGRRVRTLIDGEWLEAGVQERAWDGRNDAGRTLPTGTYFARLVSASARDEIKMTLLR